MPLNAREKALKAVVKQELEVETLKARAARKQKVVDLAKPAQVALDETNASLAQAQKVLAHLQGNPLIEDASDEEFAAFRKPVVVTGAPDNEPRLEPDIEADPAGEGHPLFG